MIRIYFAESMTDTPFQAGALRDSLGLPADMVVVEEAREADVVVARLLQRLAPHFASGRALYVWTHEPAYSTVTHRLVVDGATGARVAVSSAANGDPYPSPLVYLPSARPAPRWPTLEPFTWPGRDELRDLVRSKTRDCAILASHRTRSELFAGTRNVALSDHRQRLAVALQSQHDFCDIYGRDWPDTVRLAGESRQGAWQQDKHTILRPYRFNLAFEKALLPNYVTEKIWDAIVTGCVPVYLAPGTGIDTVLSPGSFVDASRFASAGDLHEHLAAMTDDDRWDLLDSALADAQRIRRDVPEDLLHRQVVDRFAARVRALVEGEDRRFGERSTEQAAPIGPVP